MARQVILTVSSNERRKYFLTSLEKNGIIVIEVPNITKIVYGRDVGYKIEQEHFTKDIEEISATAIRNGFTQENNIKNN